MENLPTYISIVFGTTTIVSVAFFYKAANNSKPTLAVLLTWLAIQTIVGLSGFYTVTDSLPPRFMLMVLPPLLIIVGLFTTSKGRQYIELLDEKMLTILHIVRIPVEIVLFWLFIYKTIPELMTFEGRNLDIISGITAPIIYYFGYIKNRFNRKIILFWNIIGLGLLLNIVAIAVLSAPSPFQKFALDQPNNAVLYFPFNWLPSCVVPLVLFSHLVLIRKCLKTKEIPV